MVHLRLGGARKVESLSVVPRLPRIWWMGTGLTSSLPFHAAGDHSFGSVANTLSCVLSSYTPSIRALRYVREETQERLNNYAMLLVTMPKTPGLENLPGVKDEEENIRRVLKNQSSPESIFSLRSLEQPSARSVLEHLSNYSIAHFACHGSSDVVDPSNSYLALQGESTTKADRLTVRSISDASLENAWLAYLSACSTAEVKVSELEDEALHLASSFQVVGFRHVVASRWPSNDSICSQMASLFYHNLTTSIMLGDVKDGVVAAALHDAVREIRDRYRNRPYLWAQFVHFGA